ncbi:MAG: SDR family NAD(P)-dependent oxidoreductase [Alphaproteobacteria bacterium]|nr:SDR family NAD(P)-dependent oxidoreductase [Alphaproteobacteria bacterium]
MARNILITGGAGFIGSHLCDELLEAGHRVRALDSMIPQVHGPAAARPAHLASEVELLRGDMRDAAAVRRALDGVDAVFHLASMVGVGQSMFQIDDYVGVNDLGTAVLLQALSERPVERLVVASSMSVYGEGLYQDDEGRPVSDADRAADGLRDARWEMVGRDGRPLTPLPTPEWKPPALASVYALNKFAQERMCLLIGGAYGIGTTALRFFNVYGPRQALSNPYTGVLAIFGARLLNGRPPLLFEDGGQRRDFVHVKDVARACRMAMDSPAAPGQVFNVASGHSLTIAELAARLSRAMALSIEPEITGRFRVGDIRHCFADIGAARQGLGFEPKVALDDGLVELVEWLARQTAVDHVERMTSELASRGLVA